LNRLALVKDRSPRTVSAADLDVGAAEDERSVLIVREFLVAADTARDAYVTLRACGCYRQGLIDRDPPGAAQQPPHAQAGTY
jgi:hypothetical protein